MGAGFDVDVCDPTQDKRVMEFCLSIPDEQYARDGRDRLLIRHSMEGILPPKVQWNILRGKQAADIGRRVQQDREEIVSLLKMFEESDITREYLDIQKMRLILQSLSTRIIKSSSYQIETILLRGLMAGLFLSRFEE